MTGRIKLMVNGTVLSELDTPEIDYKYDEPGPFDEACGTYDLDSSVLPKDICPRHFVCDSAGASSEMKQFASCIDAMNCHMLAGMTTNIAAESEKSLFMHQMIPHHLNAINMAKALLYSGSLYCDDLTDDSVEDCVLQGMMYEIVNRQNHQIQTMQSILQNTDNYPEVGNCDVILTADTSLGYGPGLANHLRALVVSMIIMALV
jgi:hypothetical protein